MRKLTIGLIILVLLSGCATTNSNLYANEAALIGANLGAIGGYLVGDDTKSAVIGGAIGALAGGFIGSKIEKKQPVNENPYAIGSPYIAEDGKKKIKMISPMSHTPFTKMPSVYYAGQTFFPLGRDNPMMGKCKTIFVQPVYTGDGVTSRNVPVMECEVD